jgi:hypothetical protein
MLRHIIGQARAPSCDGRSDASADGGRDDDDALTEAAGATAITSHGGRGAKSLQAILGVQCGSCGMALAHGYRHAPAGDHPCGSTGCKRYAPSWPQSVVDCLGVVPGLNVIALWVFAFSRWPALDRPSS